jgi:hypothetical protein
MPKALRVVGVTLGLIAAGALVGSTAALLAAFTVALVVFDVPTEPPDPILFGIVAGVGATLGSVLGPMAGWLGMRRVALGQLIVGAVAGAAVGALLGSGFGLVLPIGPVAGAIVGAGLGGIGAGLWLDWRAAQCIRQRATPPNEALQQTGEVWTARLRRALMGFARS